MNGMEYQSRKLTVEFDDPSLNSRQGGSSGDGASWFQKKGSVDVNGGNGESNGAKWERFHSSSRQQGSQKSSGVRPRLKLLKRGTCVCVCVCV